MSGEELQDTGPLYMSPERVAHEIDWELNKEFYNQNAESMGNAIAKKLYDTVRIPPEMLFPQSRKYVALEPLPGGDYEWPKERVPSGVQVHEPQLVDCYYADDGGVCPIHGVIHR